MLTNDKLIELGRSGKIIFTTLGDLGTLMTRKMCSVILDDPGDPDLTRRAEISMIDEDLFDLAVTTPSGESGSVRVSVSSLRDCPPSDRFDYVEEDEDDE